MLTMLFSGGYTAIKLLRKAPEDLVIYAMMLDYGKLRCRILRGIHSKC